MNSNIAELKKELVRIARNNLIVQSALLGVQVGCTAVSLALGATPIIPVAGMVICGWFTYKAVKSYQEAKGG